MHQFFIINKDEITSKINTLRKEESSKDGWSHFYKSGVEEWILTRYHSEWHGGGIPVLKRLPEPNTNELLDLALNSSNKDDIIGASLELEERERIRGDEFRDRLIQELSVIEIPQLSAFEKERLNLIIRNTEVFDSTNRRNILGKNLSEIQKDAEYFQRNSEKANEIIRCLEGYSR